MTWFNNLLIVRNESDLARGEHEVSKALSHRQIKLNYSSNSHGAFLQTLQCSFDNGSSKSWCHPNVKTKLSWITISVLRDHSMLQAGNWFVWTSSWLKIWRANASLNRSWACSSFSHLTSRLIGPVKRGHHKFPDLSQAELSQLSYRKLCYTPAFIFAVIHEIIDWCKGDLMELKTVHATKWWVTI